MPDSVPQVNTDHVASVSSTPSASNALTAGAVAQSNASAETTGSTRIGSMDELRRKAPKVYQKMLEGIAMNICREMEHHQDRLKKLMREASAG